MKSRWKDVEKKALSLVYKWVEVRRERWGLRRWGVDVRSSITLCKDSVINPLKMSDCRWLWEYQSVGQAWGKGEGRIQDGWRDAGRGKVEGQTQGESEINWDEGDTVPFKWEGWVSVTMQKKERKKEIERSDHTGVRSNHYSQQRGDKNLDQTSHVCKERTASANSSPSLLLKPSPMRQMSVYAVLMLICF